jgi:signal transduction histidine kinase/CheY-like chemotaxis protein/HPt (histidine-containing phosphotransfer) domain-containing protein
MADAQEVTAQIESRRRLISRVRLKLRLMLMSLLLVALLSALSLLIVRSVFSSITPPLRSDLRWKAQRGVVELSHSGDLGVLTGNLQQLQQSVEHYTGDADVLYVRFRGEHGQVLFERGSARGLPLEEQTSEAVAENALAFVSWAPVVIEGLRVGDVTLAVSKARLQAGAQLYRRMVLLGLLGAGAALSLAFLFVRFYIAPILRLTERTFGELEQSTRAALASAEAKTQFLANMSHEIRTPMNGVFGMLHLVRQTELSSVQRRYLDVLASSTRSLLKVVNDVLDISKLNADRYQLLPGPCALRELAGEVGTLFEQRALEKGLRLSIDVQPSTPEGVLLDADRFRQILSNLVNNAIKFTDRGSVELTLRASASSADAGPTSGRHQLEVRVDDSGIGIPEGERSRLFQVFSQLDASSRRLHEGTGLGLAICKKLLELMGGSIEYLARPEGGSCFRSALPVQACAPASPVAAQPEAANRRWSSERPLLLVDDNEVNQIVAVEVLEGLGLRVDVAMSGPDAIDAVLTGDYALVLMDCQMPEMDGYEATRQIRARQQGARVPIVAFTAHALAEEREKVRQAGMDDFLLKPLELPALEQVLSRHLPPAPASELRVSRAPAAPASKPAARAEPAPASATQATSEPLQPGLRRPPRAVELFLSRTPGEIELLRRAVSEACLGDARALAHKLKGTAGSLGAPALAQCCAALEYASSEPGPAQLDLLLAGIEQAYQLASLALRRELRDSQRPNEVSSA